MRWVRAVSIVSAMLMLVSPAWADCARPRASFQVPDGTSANAEQMAAVQKQIVEFAGAVSQYAHCLQGELGQKSIGKDDAAKAELNKQYAAAHNAVADELSGYASCYDEQADRFKSSGGGTKMKAVDCSAHIATAAKRANAAPSAEELIIEASGHTFEVPNGSWRFLLARDQEPRACGANEQCLYRAVVVMNESDVALECKGEIAYDGTDLAGNAKAESQALVSARSTRVVAASLAKANVSASMFDARCTPREKLPALDTPSTCKYQVVKPIAIGDYYPPASREAGEEGPVTVEFTLAGKAANPTNVRAVASSLYPALDEAAVKAVSDMVMSSSCPNARYRLKLSFQLN